MRWLASVAWLTVFCVQWVSPVWKALVGNESNSDAECAERLRPQERAGS